MQVPRCRDWVPRCSCCSSSRQLDVVHVVMLEARSQCRGLWRCGHAAGHHSLLQVMLPVNWCQYRCSSIILKSAGCFGFFIYNPYLQISMDFILQAEKDTFIMKVKNTLTVHKWRQISVHSIKIKLARFSQYVACKYTTNLIICRTSFKKRVIPLSLSSPTF